LTEDELAYWLPEELRNRGTQGRLEFVQQCIMNMHDRTKEEDYFAPRVLKEASVWLEQNQDADKFFLIVESFDPHEPWLPPRHYRRMYSGQQGREQVVSAYGETGEIDPALVARTRANYSGEVTMCDRWFGYFLESLRVLGLLDDTMIIFTSDHGHSIGDYGYIGKRGYPSTPEVFDVPLMIRFPGSEHGGQRSDAIVQHHDLTSVILDAAGIEPSEPLDGHSFIEAALAGEAGARDHVTVGWGSAPTVITRDWWFNCKADGTGVILRDLRESDPWSRNVAAEHTETVNELFALALEDAGGAFPDWILELARTQADAPGCSDLVARA
jgi:arylsulfatase A-like enzyme